ncbi:MAG: IS110 family transposase [Bacteroidetes bacterium]|jgi:transposase|nr:IS110 family transposase [Bacteroidota bacterium]
MTRNKQSVGIDISKDSFTACLCTSQKDGSLQYSNVLSFKNEKQGYNQLLRWIRKHHQKETELVYLMEATGVYYESLAYHLNKIKQMVHVVLPNTSKHYFLSLNVKTKTDKIDAKILSRFGVERRHKAWEPPSPLLLELRNLTRYYVQLQEQKTAINNIKHSKEEAYAVQKFILQSNKKLIAQIDKQIELCKQKIEVLIGCNKELKAKVDNILTIKGVGIITIATIIAETLGFAQVRNVKQLVSYAGYDVVQRESGTSIKGKTRISKKGNRYIRNALYFPAMVACRYNPDLKTAYLRIIMKKPSKMIGQVAIQRKLLILIYTLWRNETVFVPGYKKVALPNAAKATQDSLS